MTRKHIVYGDGNTKSKIMLIGEAPGYHEDKQGLPFVGQSGQLLRTMLIDMCNIKPETIYITNVIKCKPPGNRPPSVDEIATCTKYFLIKEIVHVDPLIIITAGKVATEFVTNSTVVMSHVIDRYFHLGKRYIIPIYHPSYILQKGLEEKYKEHFRYVGLMIGHIIMKHPEIL